MACPDEQKWKTHLKKIKNNFCVFPLVFYLLSLLAQKRFTSCHFHNFFPKYSHFSPGREKNNVSICQEWLSFFVPGGVRGIVGISLGKGCSGLKSHLVEPVMRADLRLRLGRRKILFLFFARGNAVRRRWTEVPDIIWLWLFYLRSRPKCVRKLERDESDAVRTQRAISRICHCVCVWVCVCLC